jgi:F-type H+-transporting ATPase subunit b
MMIRKDESMLLKLGRVSLFAALAMLVFAGPVSGAADDQSSTEQQAGTGDGQAAGHDQDGGDKDHDKSADHDKAGGDHDDHGDAAGTPPLLQFDFGSAICNLAIFLGVFAVLAKFVWPIILDGLKAREEKIYGDLDAAEQARTEAEKLKSDFQSQLNQAQSEIQAMLAQARKDAEANGEKIVEQAKSEAARQADRAVAEIETAKKVAISELAGHTSDMAIGVAKQIVGRELKAGDHEALIRQSLDRLPSSN